MATTKVQSNHFADGFVIIDEADFDPDTHTKWVDSTVESMVTEKSTTDAESDELMKHTKAELVAIAEAKGITVVPDDMTKAQIVTAILETEQT